MKALSHRLAACLLGALLAGCATRATHVQPLPANPAEFAAWDCTRIDDERDIVQQRAADLAYTVDERVGNNILALGVGIGIFWPAILAMRPDGPEATELAQLKGRFDALGSASRSKACPPVEAALPPERAATWPVVPGERLVYEERTSPRDAASEWVLRLHALRRDEAEFVVEGQHGPAAWRQDLAGNVGTAPPGALVWHRLLRRELMLGQVLAGEFDRVGDPLSRARVRGQVVAVGPQQLAGRRFEAVVIELFGDVQRGELSTRLDGAIVVDRASGVLLRLDLNSAAPGFQLQRRLVRVEAAAAAAPA